MAGQVMGVEGYLESAAMGLYIGHCIGHKLKTGSPLPLPPANTSLGALAHYCLDTDPKHFSPMNIHWGLFSEVTDENIQMYGEGLFISPNKKKLEKSVKRDLMARRGAALFDAWLESWK